jgi:hypothetical protein
LSIKEKRKHPRIKTENLLSYVCIDDEGNEIDEGMGKIKNVSLGGVLIETIKPIGMQDILLTTIGINDEIINMKAKVVYCKKEISGMFRTGIQFLEAKEESPVRRICPSVKLTCCHNRQIYFSFMNGCAFGSFCFEVISLYRWEAQR